MQWAGKPECDSSEKQTDRGEEKSVLVRDGKKVNTLSIRGFFTLRPLTASYPVHLSRTVSSSSELFHWWPIKYSVEAVIPAHTLSRPNRRTRFSVPSGAGPYDNMSKNHGGASLARIGMRARAHAWSYTSRGQGGGLVCTYCEKSRGATGLLVLARPIDRRGGGRGKRRGHHRCPLVPPVLLMRYG